MARKRNRQTDKKKERERERRDRQTDSQKERERERRTYGQTEGEKDLPKDVIKDEGVREQPGFIQTEVQQEHTQTLRSWLVPSDSLRDATSSHASIILTCWGRHTSLPRPT